MKVMLIVLTLTNGQFVETGRKGDPATDQPFTSVEKCNTWRNMAAMMIASRQPDAVGKIRLECKIV
jgi:hypothetical protein